MEVESVSEVLAESAMEVYQYVTDMQFVTDPPMGVSVTAVLTYDVHEGYAVLHLDGPVPDMNGMQLMVGQDVYGEDRAGFDRYDEVSRTVVIRPGREVLGRLSEEGPKVCLLSDMRFMISVCGDFWKRYGWMLTLPLADPKVSPPVFPGSSSPTASQIKAVDCVLGHRLSYIWGAPGTGKTQYVLATCIRSCIEAGCRVAVFAPTNNSVEQVLRGILKAFSGDSLLDGRVLRLGVPTKGFLAEHPEMCEDRQAQRRMASCMERLDRLEEVMFERCCDAIEEDVNTIISLVSARREDARGNVTLRDNVDIAARISEILPVISAMPWSRDSARSIINGDLRSVMSEIRDQLFDRERPAAEIDEYSDWSDVDLIGEILSAEQEILSYRDSATCIRMEHASLIVSTPYQFISRFRPKGADEDGRPEMDVDHIFLDEAGYSGLIQAASLFTNGVPVTMLGDHMQLPPVSQIDDEVLADSFSNGGRLKYGFLWSMSSLHCEGLLTSGPTELGKMFVAGATPVFNLTARADLTESHRFGRNMARVLDRFVYRNGMTGSPDGGDLEIVCIDAVCTSREGRENRTEAEAIRDYLREEMPSPESVAVLTPYSVQLALLKRSVGRKYRDCVMTVHGSQGREWDTVILSVSDNGIASRDVPLRFTSSRTSIGMKVINTAVSRAKRRLVLVCDRGFWMEREEELISGVLREVPPEEVRVFSGRPRYP